MNNILCKCKICNHLWTPKAYSILQGHSCPMCANKHRNDNNKKTHSQFIKELAEVKPNIEVLEEYINNNTKIKCKCKIDGYEWETTPNCLLNSNSDSCPKCSGNIKKTTEQFIKELAEKNSDIEVLGEYVTTETPIKCKCKIDNHIWTPTPHSLLSGQGCPKCNSSKGEKVIANYLSQHNIKFEEQYKFEDCRFYKTLPFDFYLPNENIAIEYDGKQHYKIVEYFGGLNSFIDTKIRDTIKNKYCKDNNIRLIRIPYWEFNNIEKILDKIMVTF